MTIKSITIENVRGIKSQSFPLSILPNKPSLLVAPNGFGKSSIAAAFAGLKTKRMELPKEQHHCGDDSLLPKLGIVLQQGNATVTLVADSQGNDIAPVLDVHVVTSRLRPKATKHNMGRFVTATASLEIGELELVKTVPAKVHHAYAIGSMREHFGTSGKALRNLSRTLTNPVLGQNMAALYGALDKLDGVRVRGGEIDEMTALLRVQPGKADDIRAWANATLAPRLESIDALNSVADLLSTLAGPGETRIDVLLSSLQVAFTYQQDKKLFKEACKYLAYLNEKESFEDIIRAFGATWKKVKPVERKGSLVVIFPAAMHISNGQRDSLCFAAELRKIERSLSSRDCVVVIDEVFDYLDDANLVAVQYYITRLIKKVKESGKKIYPLILTHLNPYYFRNFTFSNQKVYFLKPSKPVINKDFRALIAKRTDGTIQASVDRHFLHYDPAPVDIRKEFKTLGLREEWGESTAFQAHTKAEWNKYVNKAENYDPFAVCCFVRVRIEQIVYEAIGDIARKKEYLDTWMTKNKLDFAVEHGIDVDDTLYLLGLIYNEGMHIHESVDDSSPVVSKLENLTVRHMLMESVKP